MEQETKTYLEKIYKTCQEWLHGYYARSLAGDEITEDDLGMKEMVIAFMFLYREHFNVSTKIFEDEHSEKK